MSPFVNACAGWCRRHLALSVSRQAWQERLSFLVLLGGTVVLWLLREGLTTARLALLAGLLLLVFAILVRRGWVTLFGPVLFYDLIRTARRSRYFVIRIIYALVLLFLLCSVYLNYRDADWRVPADRMADAAAAFFATFMYVQFTVVVLLTPAYAAGAIADEKQRQTLDFLLATDLRDREIILGKLAAR